MSVSAIATNGPTMALEIVPPTQMRRRVPKNEKTAWMIPAAIPLRIPAT